MKTLKRGIALSLMTLLVLSVFLLSACGPQQSAPPATTEEGAEDVTLNIFQFKVEIAKELEEAARLYASEHPNVKINIQTVGGGDDYGAALRAKVQSGVEPTIFNIGGPQDVEDWMTRLEDLSDQPWVAQALDGVLLDVTVDGKVFALPFNIEGYGFIYNKEIFEAAEIDPSQITDFASLETAVKALDSKIKAGELKEKFPNLKAAFEVAAKETWITGLHCSNAVISQEFESSLDAYAAKKIAFKYGDGLKALLDLQSDYSANAKSKGKLNAVDYATQVDQGIAIERVAIIQQGNWIYGGVKAVDEAVANNLDILPMPVKGGKEDGIPVGVPMYWAVNNKGSDAEKAAAKDFLNWLYTSDKGKDFIVNKFFFIPPLKGYENLEPKDPLGRAVKRYAEAGKTMSWVFMGYPTGWGMNVLGVEIQKYLAGEIKWEDLLNNAQNQWEEMR
ncbi:MAG: ABC transporter substrate-binding protein [Thermotaleaceae bacterium]